ncbi:MAG: amidohydrolase [Candidatus Eisenbacteria bacterium]|nr:amidohydrolase [Candidatus Eisenbacteria bacterium]
MSENILKDAKRLAKKLSDIRRDIHMHPELGYEETRTSALIAKTLERLDIKVTKGVAKTGVVGLLKGTGKGKTVAMRADMDALPITEQNEVAYRSTVEGVMHACGHDANTTTLLGAAMLLSERRERFSGTFKFLFQPCEEAPPGGAQAMIEDGVLKKPDVDVILGVHVDPMIPIGKVGVREGPMMAAADDFRLVVLGEAAHGAKPHLGVDAIVLGSQVALALQTIPSRRINPTHPVVVTLGTVKGGYRRNIIADRVEYEGTARTLDAKDRKLVEKMIEQTAARVAKSGGGGYEFEYTRGYPVLQCDSRITDIVRKSGRALLGRRAVVELPEPSMGGEDFAFFVNEVPGMMFRTGAGNRKKGITYPWHHPKFDIDEDVLWMGAAVLADSGLRCLEEL